MKTRALTLGLCLPSIAVAQAPLLSPMASLREYTVDYGHSIVEFSIGFALTRVKGRFTNGKGTILYDEAKPVNSSITMVIDAKSIDTGWPHRDEHLRTDDFFDVEKYPSIIFQSERLTPRGNGWVAEGQLTMHGVTKPVAIAFRFPHPPSRSAESLWMVLNAEGTVRLPRADFGILGGSTHNSWFTRARAATMGDSVDVSLEIEGYSPDAASLRPPVVDEALERIRTSGVQAQIDRLSEAKRTRPQAQLPGVIQGADFVVRALIGAGRIIHAVQLSRALTELFPASTRLAAVHALALSISGDARSATREYARMKEIFRAPVVDPNERFKQDDATWWNLDQLARMTIEWRNASHGVVLARAIAELYPETARAHTTLGVLLAATGDMNGASGAYAKALSVDSRETRALEWRRRLPNQGRGRAPQSRPS